MSYLVIYLFILFICMEVYMYVRVFIGVCMEVCMYVRVFIGVYARVLCMC